MEVEASPRWGRRHLSSYSNSPGLPHLLGEAGRREKGVELPLNRTQIPETTSLLNSRVPSTDWAGRRGGLEKDRNKMSGDQTRDGPIGHRRRQKWSSLCQEDPQIHTLLWKQPEQSRYRRFSSPTPEAQRYTCTQAMHASKIPHSDMETGTDEHQETGREMLSDIGVGRPTGANKHKRNSSCWKH